MAKTAKMARFIRHGKGKCIPSKTVQKQTPQLQNPTAVSSKPDRSPTLSPTRKRLSPPLEKKPKRQPPEKKPQWFIEFAEDEDDEEFEKPRWTWLCEGRKGDEKHSHRKRKRKEKKETEEKKEQEAVVTGTEPTVQASAASTTSTVSDCAATATESSGKTEDGTPQSPSAMSQKFLILPHPFSVLATEIFEIHCEGSEGSRRMPSAFHSQSISVLHKAAERFLVHAFSVAGQLASGRGADVVDARDFELAVRIIGPDGASAMATPIHDPVIPEDDTPVSSLDDDPSLSVV